MPTAKIDMPALIERFGSEEKCRAYLEELRWPQGVRCIRCESDKISRIKKRAVYECDGCGYQFSVRAGTIFHDSKLPLWKWFLAIYMMVQAKKGVSANQIKRMLGVSYKTAWFLCHRIRAAMKDTSGDLLRGIVEIDDTYVGGKHPGGQPTKFDNKTTVIGAVERGGKVRLAAMPNRGKKNFNGFIARTVDGDVAAIYTDEYWRAGELGDENTVHPTVNHRRREYVLPGDIHTNTIEGVWALLKRSIAGSYHKLSVKHLPAYLDEVAFKYNNRDNAYLFRDTLLELIRAERVEYRRLTA